MSDAFLNCVNPYINSKNEGRATALVTITRYHKATRNQTQQIHGHCARIHIINTNIKILLDSKSDCDLMFHEMGIYMLILYLTSLQTSNGNFLAT